MSNVTLQIFKDEQLIEQKPLDELNGNIKATDDMAFRFTDSATEEIIQADYTLQNGEDLVVVIGQEELVIEDYFAVDNAGLINSAIPRLEGEQVLASEITATEAGAPSNVATNSTMGITPVLFGMKQICRLVRYLPSR